ncbi:protein NUCLEAR FUSION DEFECTIVE 4-like [Rhodamnia argentea]|uniref:Protein NUCLEAR FUSION DEFECTIVE 4-like n=1 Tax=Rhodamnia argentea TaxID=178133 RepID=A0A8B8NK49_9MYRT|nr:protein NUCLEAR FUSION DEFECTIVE 4-like [Rhodamnia argentea]
MVFQRHSKSNAAKWLGLVTAVWVQAISGNNYTFSNYSDALKSIMNLTQVELNDLSVAKDIGKAFGLLAGLASDRLPPWVILLIGSVEGFVGYGAQWLVVSERATLSYWQMCIVMCMGGNSTTWMNTAILVTCIRNFRKNRGPVSGILKGYVGLSTAIFTDICTALFSDSAASFLLMLAVVPFGVCLTAMVFLREVPPSAADEGGNQDESRYFTILNGVAVVVAFYLLAYDFIGSSYGSAFNLAFVGILLVLLVSPLLIPLYDLLKSFKESGSLDVEGAEAVGEPLLASQETAEAEVQCQQATEEPEMAADGAEEVKRKPVIGEDHTIFEAMRTYDFWILFTSFLCGVGTGLAVQNNMGQIGSALGYSDVSVFVSLISIWGFFGRIISGTGSEYLIKKKGSPRPWWNAGSQIVMALGFVAMAWAFEGSLYVGSIVVGLCYGVRLAITVPTASELFGLKYYGLIYNVLILNLPLGSFLFSGVLAGYIYDAEATSTASGGDTCSGAHCYRIVFIVMAVACLIGCVLDALLAIKTKALYAKIQASKNSEKS